MSYPESEYHKAVDGDRKAFARLRAWEDLSGTREYSLKLTALHAGYYASLFLPHPRYDAADCVSLGAHQRNWSHMFSAPENPGRVVGPVLCEYLAHYWDSDSYKRMRQAFGEACFEVPQTCLPQKEWVKAVTFLGLEVPMVHRGTLTCLLSLSSFWNTDKLMRMGPLWAHFVEYLAGQLFDSNFRWLQYIATRETFCDQSDLLNAYLSLTISPTTSVFGVLRRGTIASGEALLRLLLGEREQDFQQQDARA